MFYGEAAGLAAELAGSGLPAKMPCGLDSEGLERKAGVFQRKGEIMVKDRDKASNSLQVVFPRIRSCFPGATGLCFQQIFPDRQI